MRRTKKLKQLFAVLVYGHVYIIWSSYKLKTERLENAQKQNSKDMWKLIRKNKSPTSSLSTCTYLFEYFKDLGNPSDVSYVADDDIYERIRTYDEGLLNDLFQELNDVITLAEVIKAFKELKSGESAGPDLLINDIFVNTCETITDKLVIYYNF